MHPVRRPYTYRELQELVLDRNRATENAGYKVIVIRECEIKAELNRNERLRVSVCFSVTVLRFVIPIHKVLVVLCNHT